jgi:type II secretory pathway predicted ATPase ExeA
MDSEKTVKMFNWESNPFTFKILPDFFVGYSKEVNTLYNGMENGNKTSLLLGPTGSGKTTLIKHIITKFEKYKNILYLPKPPKNPDDWITVFSSFTRQGFLHALFHRNNNISLYELSDHMNKKLKDQKLFLFVDECHEASIDSLEWLRTLTDHVDNLYVMLAGLPVFEAIIRENLETFTRRISTKIELTNLTKAETRELIKKRIEGCGGEDIRPFSQNTIDFIYERTGGFPREIIRLCNELAQKALEKNISIIDIDFLQEVSAPEERISLENINQLPERQRLILETLARKGELTPSEVIANLDIEEYKDKDNAVRSVNNLLKRLMSERLVERRRIGKTYKYRVSAKFHTMLVSA